MSGLAGETETLWLIEAPQLATLADTKLLLESDVIARHNQALLGLASFRERYTERGPLAPTPPADTPAGSLGRELSEFLAWYELEPGFFPSDPRMLEAMDPTEFAAHMLSVYHDVLHVLTGHNTSDRDEVAIQSFMLGQAPIAFARFIANVAAAPDLATAPRYKHLRDLLACPIDHAALARGRAARPLLDLEFEALWHEPIAGLRDQLAIGRFERGAIDASPNTCGGRPAPHFFR